MCMENTHLERLRFCLQELVLCYRLSRAVLLGCWWIRRPAGLSWEFCCSKKNALRSTCVPLASEGGRLYRFSAWMQISCDHKNLRKLKRSLDIFQSTLLARTKPIPKRPWQIFAEGIGSSVLQELSPAVARSLSDSADVLERASCWAKSLPQFCVEFFNSGFTSSQSFWNFRELLPGKRLGDSY